MEEYPEKKNIGDLVHKTIHTSLSSVPGYGAPLAAIFDTVFTEPIENRKKKWFNKLTDVINEIQSQLEGVTPESLSKNEIFISTVLQASRTAIRTHQEEKLNYLKNVIYNTAKGSFINEDIQSIYLNLIDSFTVSHIELLELLSNPGNYIKLHGIKCPEWSMGGVSAVIEHCIPQFRGKKEFYSILIRDLYAGGLITDGSFLGVTMSASGMLQKRSSALGDDFINFIIKSA